MTSLLRKAARINLMAMDFVMQVTVVELVLGTLAGSRTLSFELSRGTKVRRTRVEMFYFTGPCGSDMNTSTLCTAPVRLRSFSTTLRHHVDFVFRFFYRFYKMLKNVSCEYDRLNG